MSASQFEYWKHTQFMVDVTNGWGASFSLAIPLGIGFLILSRLFREEQTLNIAPVLDGEEYVNRSV